jgi:hypothetical protein
MTPGAKRTASIVQPNRSSNLGGKITRNGLANLPENCEIGFGWFRFCVLHSAVWQNYTNRASRFLWDGSVLLLILILGPGLNPLNYQPRYGSGDGM